MGAPANSKKSYEIVDIVKLGIPWRSEPSTMSRDFWMPDQSCRVCYECDSQFSIFNRKHHCRICGRVFCAKCTSNSIPVPSSEENSGREDRDRIRVCDYCFKQWKKGSTTGDNLRIVSTPGLSTSPSSSSLVSNQSSCCTCDSGSSGVSAQYSTGSFQHVSCDAGEIPCRSPQRDAGFAKQDSAGDYSDARDNFGDQFGSFIRSDDEDDEYTVYRSHSEPTPSHTSGFRHGSKYNQIDHIYERQEMHSMEEIAHPTSNSTSLDEDFGTQRLEHMTKLSEQAEDKNNSVQPEPPPLSDSNDVDIEAVDYENNDLLWFPPEPENEEDERVALLSDDDDGGGEAPGEWGYMRTGSFGGAECRSRDRSNEEHRKAMKRVVDGHFRTLIAQLLQAENLPATGDGICESWLDIITTLSWETATILKPDTSMGGGMDPGGYVKVKCIASGRRNESVVVKGVVCKKNVAHRRMTSKIDKARLLLLGGALEYQRVANHLSSFHTLLQQEMDHLKMAVAKIDAHHPNVLLVEKSVSRYAQEYLLAKDISLVLNVKRPLLESIARCTGAQIVPSIDNLSAPKLGQCDSFRVEKFMEDIGRVAKDGKKIPKTLMFFEGCPRPLGCTILLKGASLDELKKVKHVVHYGVFAAYHLALETSFLADEGASLPELPLTSPIKVALPDKSPNSARSISMVPGYTVSASEKPQVPQSSSEPHESGNDLFLNVTLSKPQSSLSKGSSAQASKKDSSMGIINHDSLEVHPQEQLTSVHHSKKHTGVCLNEVCTPNMSVYLNKVAGSGNLDSNNSFESTAGRSVSSSYSDGRKVPYNLENSELVSMGQNTIDHPGELGPLKEEFLLSPSDHQSILVSLSTRCVWKGSVCERAHLFRIKYYGTFDKPLGRFLWDNLFDQGYRCRSCEMPPEAHIHCYTHRQGSLTISVKKFPDSLSGKREGKIWMWHRCLRCPRPDGYPPATKRVVMSDAAWGLSFGKFLELSFSNHAAASRVASCGHSLHRDCLRFYGLGSMVACFRYAPIEVHSVYLPPSKLEFDYCKQDWIQHEFDEVRSKADILFLEVFKVVHEILEKINNKGMKVHESDKLIVELQLMLQKEREEFKELFRCLLNKEVKFWHPAIDILEINRIRRQLIFHSYFWDQCLIHVNRSTAQTLSSSIKEEKSVDFREKHNEMEGKGFSSWDSSLSNIKPDLALSEVGHSGISLTNGIHEETDKDQNLSHTQSVDPMLSSCISLSSSFDSKDCGKIVRRARSEGQFPVMKNLNDDPDAARTGNQCSMTLSSNGEAYACPEILPKETGNSMNDEFVAKETDPLRTPLGEAGSVDVDNPTSWLGVPFSVLYHSFEKNYSANPQKLTKIMDYNPVYIPLFKELVNHNGARLLLPVASVDTIVPIYDDEPTSIISYALLTTDHQKFMSGETDRKKDRMESSSSLSILDSVNLFSFHFSDEPPSEFLRSFNSADENSVSSGYRSLPGLDSLLSPNTNHARISFSDDGPPGKVKYSVTCYFAKQFEALRRICCASELDFIRSLSRCKKWGAQGGKSNVFFAKTLDDRFIIKQVTKTELESFMQFAPSYFKYLSESINSGCPTCLAKILGIYQVTTKHLKGGKESRMDVLVMENLLFRRNITRLYDLKGSARSRYNPDSSGGNKVLLDQNLIEAMPTSPIFLGTKAKRLLERAVWNDTSFLASIDVMDYSLLVGVDEEKHELVLGIIDFMRQYTWDKHLETWVKASGILGGPKNESPTVISPQQYKKRFRKAMSAYFLMVPDQWPSSMILPAGSQSNLREENSRDRQ